MEKGNGLKKNKRKFVFIMLAIPCIHWLVFWLYININSILFAFKLPAGGWSLNNFVMFWDSLTARGGEINIALKNTLAYFLSTVVVVIPFSIFIAYFIYKRIVAYKFFRIIFYLPAIISTVALVGVYKEFIQPWGPLVKIIESIGGKTPVKGFLGDYNTATGAIVAYCIWTGFAGNMLLFSGAMSRIPLEIIEAEKIEGCGFFAELIHVILPLIWPTISTVLIFTMTGIFTSSGPILLFTEGQFETMTISYWIFNNVYKVGGGSYNMVSCAGLCFTVAGVPIILFVRWLLDRFEAVEY